MKQCFIVEPVRQTDIFTVLFRKMSRNRKRKTNKGQFTEDRMRQGIQLVNEQGYSCRRAAEAMDLSYVTLSR